MNGVLGYLLMIIGVLVYDLTDWCIGDGSLGVDDMSGYHMRCFPLRKKERGDSRMIFCTEQGAKYKH